MWNPWFLPAGLLSLRSPLLPSPPPSSSLCALVGNLPGLPLPVSSLVSLAGPQQMPRQLYTPDCTLQAPHQHLASSTDICPHPASARSGPHHPSPARDGRLAPELTWGVSGLECGFSVPNSRESRARCTQGVTNDPGHSFKSLPGRCPGRCQAQWSSCMPPGSKEQGLPDVLCLSLEGLLAGRLG